MAEVLASSSGYRLSRQQGLASHGGMKDWFIREFSRPGFTVELGKGVNPLPLSSWIHLPAGAGDADAGDFAVACFLFRKTIAPMGEKEYTKG